MKLNLNLKTKYIGKNAYFFKKIDSTQSMIQRLIDKKKIVNGMLIMCDIQTNGKGTHGRRWITDEKNNIAFSIYIESDCKINKIENITIDIANILINIFESLYNIKIEIRKPNDLYIKGKKVGGILTEVRTSNCNVKYIVIGIGINTVKENFNNNLPNCIFNEIATSIKNEFHTNINRNIIIEEFCNRFEKYLFENKIILIQK